MRSYWYALTAPGRRTASRQYLTLIQAAELNAALIASRSPYRWILAPSA